MMRQRIDIFLNSTLASDHCSLLAADGQHIVSRASQYEHAVGDQANLMKVVGAIREDLNPHPAGQKTLNAPKNDAITGVQHKNSETVLVFLSHPKHAMPTARK